MTYFCNVKFVAVNREITVDNVWPSFGPLAGGTRVTITGSSLNVSTVSAVYFGLYTGYLVTTRLFCPRILYDSKYHFCDL